jgi:hypothetical protein
MVALLYTNVRSWLFAATEQTEAERGLALTEKAQTEAT